MPTDDVPTSTTDVLVVGGGPAGAAAAINLARDGRSVMLIDKAVFPRDKCCGDGLTTLALRELESLGFDPGTSRTGSTSPAPHCARRPAARSSSRCRRRAPTRRSPRGSSSTTPSSDSPARRASTSATARHSSRSTNSADRVVVRAGDIEIVSRYVVAADGMWSPVRKAVGASIPRLPRRVARVPAVRDRRDRPGGRAAPRLVRARPAPRVRVVVPAARRPGQHRLRRAARRDLEGKEMKALWADLLARPHIAEALGRTRELEERHTAWPIPARVDEIELTSGRVLFAGDAAAATDVMTGEGIGQALLTGRLAAEAIVAAGALQPRWPRHLRARGRFHLARRSPMSRGSERCSPPSGAPAARSASSRRAASGVAGTSPAGCSRTSRGRSCSPRAAGTAGSSPARAPYAAAD